MSTNVAVSRHVTISSSFIKGTGFDSSLVLFEENQEPLYFPCDRSQANLLFQIREMLMGDTRLDLLINKAEELFRNKGNEGIFYNIIEDEIANIELNGDAFFNKEVFKQINSRNRRFLSRLEDNLKASSIYTNGGQPGFYSSGISIVREVVEEELLVNENEAYNNFDELFHDPKLISKCYQVLKDQNIIGEAHNYISSLKTAIVVWYRALLFNNLIVSINQKEEEIIRLLLNDKFAGLKLGVKTLNEPSRRATKKYYELFKENLPFLPRIK